MKATFLIVCATLALLAGPVARAVLPDQCGCMDVVLVVDNTGSMGPALDNVRQELPDIITIAQFASGGDLRLGLVTFPEDNVVVNLPFTNDIAAAQAAVGAIALGGGGALPESSDEALKLAVTGSADSSCSVSNAPLGNFRPACLKIAVLITDALPGGCDDTFVAGVDDVNAQGVADSAAAAGIRVSSIFVPTGGDDPTIETIMRAYATTTGGIFVKTDADGTGTGEGISDIIGGCGTAQIGTCVTRPARFWFTHASDANINCTTLKDGILANGGRMRLGFITLPVGFRNDDNVQDAEDTLIEALGLYWRPRRLTGEFAGTQNLEQPAAKLCVERKRLAAELIAATANIRLLANSPTNCVYFNGVTVTNFPATLLADARTVAAGVDIGQIRTTTALLRKFNSIGATNALPGSLLECSAQDPNKLRALGRDPTLQTTCPGINDTCAAAEAIVFKASSDIFAGAKATRRIDLTTFHDDFPSPGCAVGGADAFWKITPTVGLVDRHFTVSAEGSSFTALLSVFGGTCSNRVLVGCTTSVPGFTSPITFTTDGTNTLFIVVEGVNGAVGSVKLRVTSP